MGTHTPDMRSVDAHTGPLIAIRVSLTAILGMPVTDADGHLCGKLSDVAITTGPDGGKVAGLVLKTRTGLALVPSQEVMETPAGTLEVRSTEAIGPLREEGNYLFLQQDLVDRQIIDINGRKVVRVNDVDLEWMGKGAAHLLRVAEVEVGLRGAFRRVFKGVLPRARLEAISRKFSARAIPWQFVDVIEPDPARRVRLRIEHERLADIHPSELADILEDLAPAEREAVLLLLTRRSRPRPSKRSSPSCKRRCSKSSARNASPTSWKRWTPALPPTCSPNCPKTSPTPFSKKWNPRSGRRSRSCWSSTRTPRPA